MADFFRALMRWLLRLLGRAPEQLPESEPPAPEPEEDPPTADTEPEPLPEEPVVAPKPPLLERGDQGENVEHLQTLLNHNGAKLTIDGDFGPATEGALRDLQQSYGLETSGKADEATWAVLERPFFNQDPEYEKIPLKPETEIPTTGLKGAEFNVVQGWNNYGALLTTISGVLGFNPSCAASILAVESGGQGFEDGLQIIRFENHIFWSRWGKNHPEEFNRHFRFNPDQRWTGHFYRISPDDPWVPMHTGSESQAHEWVALDIARKLDDTAGLLSISMGAPQIMGFNYALIGFPSVQAMFGAFNHEERVHVLALFDFIRADHKMVRYLRTANWSSFADIYNGSGKAQSYGDHIAQGVAAAKAHGIP